MQRSGWSAAAAVGWVTGSRNDNSIDHRYPPADSSGRYGSLNQRAVTRRHDNQRCRQSGQRTADNITNAPRHSARAIWLAIQRFNTP